MRRRPRRDPSTEDAQAVERTRAALTGYLAEGGPGVAVSVAHVLDLLKPPGVGMWSFDPEYRKAQPVPDADPLTGARWAGPPGSAPPA